MSIGLTLVVLRCADVQASRTFYEALGLAFVEEQHGDGPVHYAATLGGTVLELYPARDRPSSPGRLGFAVDDVQGSLRAARAAGGQVRASSGPDRVVVEDPDGVPVELTESP